MVDGIRAKENDPTLNAIEAAALRARDEAEKISKLQKEVEHQINIIKSLNLPAAQQDALIAALQSALGPGMSADAISRVLANSQVSTNMAVMGEAIHDAMTMEILNSDYPGLNEYERSNVKARAMRVNLDDKQSVHKFAEAMVTGDNDIPPHMHKKVVENVEKLITKDPETKANIETLNKTSTETRVRVHADAEVAKKGLEAAKKNPKTKDEAERGKDLGTAYTKEEQNTQADHKAGRITDEQANERRKITNDKQHDAIAKNIQTIMPYLSEDVRKQAEQIDGPDAIIKTAHEAFKKRSEGKKLEPRDEVAIEVLQLARQQEIIKCLSASAVALELEKGKGTVQERGDKAMAILTKNPEFKNIPPAKLQGMVTSLFNNADQYDRSIDSLDGYIGASTQAVIYAKEKQFNLEVYNESGWGKSFDTGTAHLSAGVGAMLAGDGSGAEKAALSVGRGTKRLLEKTGISEETAQKVGSKVTGGLQNLGAAYSSVVGASRETGAVDVAANAMESVANTAGDAMNKAKIAWNASDNIAAALKDKKLNIGSAIKLTGDEKQDVASIKSALEKAGVNLASFDADRSGSLNAAELNAALKQAQLQPTATPTVAANKTVPTRDRS